MKTLLLIVSFLLSSSLLFANPPPTSFHDWTLGEWNELSRGERQYFIYGMVVATWVISTAYDNSTTVSDLKEKAEYFQEILHHDVDFLDRALIQALRHERGTPIWALLYRIPNRTPNL